MKLVLDRYQWADPRTLKTCAVLVQSGKTSFELAGGWWHRACYNRFINASHSKRAQERYESSQVLSKNVSILNCCRIVVQLDEHKCHLLVFMLLVGADRMGVFISNQEIIYLPDDPSLIKRGKGKPAKRPLAESNSSCDETPSKILRSKVQTYDKKM